MSFAFNFKVKNNCLLSLILFELFSGDARYKFTHEILPQECSKFKGKVIERDRRISVICRNEPNSSLE